MLLPPAAWKVMESGGVSECAQGSTGPPRAEDEEPHTVERIDNSNGIPEVANAAGSVTEESDKDTEDHHGGAEDAEEEPQTGHLQNGEESPQDGEEFTEAEAEEGSGDDDSEGEEPLFTTDPMVNEDRIPGGTHGEASPHREDLITPDTNGRLVGDMPEVQEEVQEEVPSVDHEEVMRTLCQLQDERDCLMQRNSQLQARLAELLHKKVGEEVRHEPQKVASDPEQRYLRCMAVMEELREQYQQEAESHQHQAEQLQLQTQEKLKRVKMEWRALQTLKRDVATEALARRVGRQAAQAQVEQIQEAEQHREKELVHVRLENVRLRRRAQRYEAALRGKEELAGGLHFIDFEQLKIENQTYGEKLEERGEELLRLRRKITNTVQELTHVREKLHFVAEENEVRRRHLVDVEAAVGRTRDVLTHTKQARDSLRADNLRLRQRCGLLGQVTLLRDWEDKVSAIEELEQRLDTLKRRHAELVEHCSSVKRKLQQAKAKN
ncbi:hypothetical protein GN956_G1592 [Arapaima gigas]